jgi:hypothetical protein
LRCSFLGVEVGEVVVEATNRIEVGAVGRMPFAVLGIVPDSWMLECDVGFGDVADRENCVVMVGFDMGIDAQIRVVGEEVRTSTSIVDNVRGMEV